MTNDGINEELRLGEANVGNEQNSITPDNLKGSAISDSSVYVRDPQRVLQAHPLPWHLEWTEGQGRSHILHIQVKDVNNKHVTWIRTQTEDQRLVWLLVSTLNGHKKACAADMLNLSIGRLARAIQVAEGEFAEATEGSVAKNYLQGVRNGLAEAQLALIKDAKLLENKP